LISLVFPAHRFSCLHVSCNPGSTGLGNSIGTQEKFYNRNSKETGIKNKLAAQKPALDQCISSYKPSSKQQQQVNKREMSMKDQAQKLGNVKQTELEHTAFRGEFVITPRIVASSPASVTPSKSQYTGKNMYIRAYEGGVGMYGCRVQKY